MRFYEFIDKAPPIGRVVVVEGSERLFAERAIATIVERRLAPGEIELNLDRIDATAAGSFAHAEAAVAALPFLGSARVVVLRGAHELRADPRRELPALAERTPEGNTLVIEDLVSPASRRPEPIGKLLGRHVLRIDTTPGHEARERFVREQLTALGVEAEPAAAAALIESESDLTAVRTDLEKLSLAGKRITLDAVLRESLVTEEVKAFHFASAAVAGRTVVALTLAHEMFGNDPRGAAVPLLAALAAEYGFVWEMARAGGELPARQRWRERELRGTARRLGERAARRGFERALRGFEAVVTGRADDPRTVVDLAVVDAPRPTSS